MAVIGSTATDTGAIAGPHWPIAVPTPAVIYTINGEEIAEQFGRRFSESALSGQTLAPTVAAIEKRTPVFVIIDGERDPRQLK